MAGAGVFVAILAGWVANVALYYRLPTSLFAKGLWYAALQTPFLPVLWIGPVLGLVLGIVVFAVCVKRYANHFGGSVFVGRLRGPKMVSQYLLANATRKSRARAAARNSCGLPPSRSRGRSRTRSSSSAAPPVPARACASATI